jgi:hypothetical protein
VRAEFNQRDLNGALTELEATARAEFTQRGPRGTLTDLGRGGPGGGAGSLAQALLAGLGLLGVREVLLHAPEGVEHLA